MAFTKATSLLATATALLSAWPHLVTAHGEDDYDHMGPLGFMWPEDREWNDEAEAMTGPCGVSGDVVNRTEFPIANGALALEQKQEVYNVQISIALDSNPSNDTDFQVILSADRVPSLDFSHVCLDIPSLNLDGEAGANATIQLRYTAEYIDPDHDHRRLRGRHLPVNETFYACADVTLVEAEAFTFEIPCFNATAVEDDDHEEEEEHGHSHDDDEDGDEDHEHDDDEDEGHGHSLSGGDIAGIVVGSVVGVAVIATIAWYFWRRDRREKQVAQAIIENQEK